MHALHKCCFQVYRGTHIFNYNKGILIVAATFLHFFIFLNRQENSHIFTAYGNIPKIEHGVVPVCLIVTLFLSLHSEK